MPFNKNKNRKSILKKPLVLKKMVRYRKKAKRGEYALQLMELNYNNECNFTCEHCFSKELPNSDRRITISDVKNLAIQADDIGVWQWHLQGGEPLIWTDLDDVIKAINPERFHIMITTNGFLLTQDRADHLADMGVDKVSVSLDSFNKEAHDTFRNKQGSYEKAIAALFHSKNAGMQTNINTVITRQNVKTQGVLDIIEFAEKNGFTILFVVATSSGEWAGRTDMLINEEDAKYLNGLKEKHSIIHRDLYPLFDFDWGCRTMNGLVYITENGDLLSCPFIHISIGNILDEPLQTILERGWSVKYFRDYKDKCIAGEDLHFIKKYMSKALGRKGPVPFNEVFKDEDLYDS